MYFYYEEKEDDDGNTCSVSSLLTNALSSEKTVEYRQKQKQNFFLKLNTTMIVAFLSSFEILRQLLITLSLTYLL